MHGRIRALVGDHAEAPHTREGPARVCARGVRTPKYISIAITANLVNGGARRTINAPLRLSTAFMRAPLRCSAVGLSDVINDAAKSSIEAVV